MDTNNDAKQTVRTALFNTGTNMISLVVGMIIVPIITRVISTEDLGIATTFLSTRNIMTILVTLAVYAYVNKAMLEFKEEKKNYIYTMVVFCAFTIILFFVVSLLIKNQLQALLSLDNFLFYWLFFSCYFLAVYNIGNYYCIFHNQYIKVSLMGFALGTVTPIIAVVLPVSFTSHKYIGRVLGLDFAYIIVTICVMVWMFFSPGKIFRKKYIKHTLKFTIPVMPHLFSQVILTQCDLIMITYFSGSSRTGIYSMGHTVGYLALIVVTQIMAAWSPWVYRRFEEKNIAAVYQNSKLVILLGTYISLGLLTISTELIQIFLTKEYASCVYIVPPLVVAMYFQFIYLFFYDLEYYNKKAKWIACASVAASALNIVLNWIFIPQVGYMAACYTTGASYLLLVFLNYLFCRRLQVDKVYDIKYILFFIIIMLAYTVMVFVFLDKMLIRYLIFLGITAGLYLWKFNDFKKLWKLMKQ